MNAKICSIMFRCTVDQAKAQYAANAAGLRKQEAKARKLGPGRKYSGKTAEQWAVVAARYESLARGETVHFETHNPNFDTLMSDLHQLHP